MKPSRWLPFIVAAWGVVTTLSGLVQNFGGLVAIRLALGLCEGGLLPGIVRPFFIGELACHLCLCECVRSYTSAQFTRDMSSNFGESTTVNDLVKLKSRCVAVLGYSTLQVCYSKVRAFRQFLTHAHSILVRSIRWYDPLVFLY
jgi:hypothetical protein